MDQTPLHAPSSEYVRWINFVLEVVMNEKQKNQGFAHVWIPDKTWF